MGWLDNFRRRRISKLEGKLENDNAKKVESSTARNPSGQQIQIDGAMGRSPMMGRVTGAAKVLREKTQASVDSMKELVASSISDAAQEVAARGQAADMEIRRDLIGQIKEVRGIAEGAARAAAEAAAEAVSLAAEEVAHNLKLIKDLTASLMGEGTVSTGSFTEDLKNGRLSVGKMGLPIPMLGWALMHPFVSRYVIADEDKIPFENLGSTASAVKDYLFASASAQLEYARRGRQPDDMVDDVTANVLEIDVAKLAALDDIDVQYTYSLPGPLVAAAAIDADSAAFDAFDTIDAEFLDYVACEGGSSTILGYGGGVINGYSFDHDDLEDGVDLVVGPYTITPTLQADGSWDLAIAFEGTADPDEFTLVPSCPSTETFFRHVEFGSLIDNYDRTIDGLQCEVDSDATGGATITLTFANTPTAVFVTSHEKWVGWLRSAYDSDALIAMAGWLASGAFKPALSGIWTLVGVPLLRVFQSKPDRYGVVTTNNANPFV